MVGLHNIIMLYNFKICFPIYKLLYSVAFMMIFTLLRPTATPYEIMVVIETSICFLATVFIADAYYTEFSGNRIDVFYLQPSKSKYKTILQRFLMEVIYLEILVITFFWLYVILQKNRGMYQDKLLEVYINTIACCILSIIFFSTLSFTIVNFLQNFWLGVGLTLMSWLLFTSKIKEHIPIYFNIFAYKIGVKIVPFYLSRVIYVLISIGLISLNYFILLQPPKRKVRGNKYDRYKKFNS